MSPRFFGLARSGAVVTSDYDALKEAKLGVV